MIPGDKNPIHGQETAHARLNWLKFDIFELMFNEIFVIRMHNSQLVYNFYEQAIKRFL